MLYIIEALPIQKTYRYIAMLTLQTNFTAFRLTSILWQENVIHFLYREWLHIPVWEFICCQSPRHMKCLFFFLLYSIQAINQLLLSSATLILENL